MSSARGTRSTVRFLQEETHRLLERNEELKEENTRLRETLKSLSGLLGTVSKFDPTQDIHRLLNRIVYEAVRIVDAVEGSLLLVDEARQHLVFMAARSEMRDQLLGYRIPLDEGIAGWVVKNQEPAISNDVNQDERFSSAVDKHIEFRTQSLVALPLISRGKVLGVIELVNKFSAQPFDEQDVETLLLLAALAAMAIDLTGLRTK